MVPVQPIAENNHISRHYDIFEIKFLKGVALKVEVNNIVILFFT
jgi:hypothetical protein